MVEESGLENRQCPQGQRGFESHPLRHMTTQRRPQSGRRFYCSYSVLLVALATKGLVPRVRMVELPAEMQRTASTMMPKISMRRESPTIAPDTAKATVPSQSKSIQVIFPNSPHGLRSNVFLATVNFIHIITYTDYFFATIFIVIHRWWITQWITCALRCGKWG